MRTASHGTRSRRSEWPVCSVRARHCSEEDGAAVAVQGQRQGRFRRGARAGRLRHARAHVNGKNGYFIVATESQAARLDRGRDVSVTRMQKGKVQAFAAPNPLADPDHGYNVFRPWSLEPAPCPSPCTTPHKPLKEWYDDM